eukprot:TRINITY_DN1779_c0_g1_i1.p1 TRINITY_DN1779_c0_g1~~TRINITY_DN1779_c0_g1_i1.p1  ORF type:complete len:431 (+),score=161.55 TRINITY_DN1779_c0_g1_i1:51-1343(+)
MDLQDINTNDNINQNDNNNNTVNHPLAFDPFGSLPSDVSLYVLTFLPAADLVKSSQTSKLWNSLSNSNWLWFHLTNRLWSDKVYIPENIKKLQHSQSSKQAFISSIHDSKRNEITVEELCTCNWFFRFKSSAGEAWTQNDPWWLNKDPTQIFFSPDGSMRRSNIVFPYSTIQSSSNSNSNFNSSLNSDPNSQNSQKKEKGEGEEKEEEQIPKQNFLWKFLEAPTHPVSAREKESKREKGRYIKVNNFPTYVAKRYNKNWGWIMQSCWVVMTSFPLPERKKLEEGKEPHWEGGGAGIMNDLKDENLEVTVENQGMEAFSYNMGLDGMFERLLRGRTRRTNNTTTNNTNTTNTTNSNNGNGEGVEEENEEGVRGVEDFELDDILRLLMVLRRQGRIRLVTDENGNEEVEEEEGEENGDDGWEDGDEDRMNED